MRKLREKFTVYSIPQVDLYGTESREAVGNTVGVVHMLSVREHTENGIQYTERTAYIFAENRRSIAVYLPYMQMVGESGTYTLLSADRCGKQWVLKCTRAG